MAASTPVITRRELLALAGAAMVAAVAGCGSTPAAVSTSAGGAVEPPSRVAYGMVLNNGTWQGPTSAGGAPDLSLVDAIAAPAAGRAVPSYLRMTSAPATGSEVPARGSVGLAAGQKLMGAGVKLGVAVSVAPSSRANQDAAAVVAHARQIASASAGVGGFYEWIFLDHANMRIGAGGDGVDDLQLVVDGVAAAGWSRIMINATGFGPQQYPKLPLRTWAVAKHLDVFDGDWRANVAQVVGSGTGAVTSGDQGFIQYVRANRPGSSPLLKLEVPSESELFRTLSQADQIALLRLWAEAEPRYGFHQIYPLFLPGPTEGPAPVGYDSQTAGTLDEQRALMEQYG